MRAALGLLILARAAAQCIVTVAGPLTIPGSPATSQQLTQPAGIVSDGASGWYVADLGANTILQIRANATAVVVMGVPRGSSTTAPGDGRWDLSTSLARLVWGATVYPHCSPATSAVMNSPANIASDGAGGVLIADRWVRLYPSQCRAHITSRPLPRRGMNIVRRLGANGTALRVAGNLTLGSSGDGGPAAQAMLASPAGVASDGAGGGVWIADTLK